MKTIPINKEYIPASNSINVNNRILNREKKCKDFYWHLINTFSYTPNNILKWLETYPHFDYADLKTWHRIFKLSFHVKIQTFQYKIVHRIISCKKWLFNIKIKTSEVCAYCKYIDDIPHFFFHCTKVREF